MIELDSRSLPYRSCESRCPEFLLVSQMLRRLGGGLMLPSVFPFSSFLCRRRAPLFSSPSYVLGASIHMSVSCFTSATSSFHNPSDAAVSGITSDGGRRRKRERRESPEGLLKFKFDMRSKNGDLVEALRLYDDARRNDIQLGHHHYNALLYLCSSGALGSTSASNVDSDVLRLGLERGFEIFQHMLADSVAPNEATFTSAARVAAAMEDPEMAFHLVKQMQEFNIPPKLRSYGPALFGFCNKGMADKAHEVDVHMIQCGVLAEEPEISALLRLSADSKNSDKVYELLHRLRATVWQVSESTAAIIEQWFKSKDAAGVGKANWDSSVVREAAVKRGGGWHGQGWLQSGKWEVTRTVVNESGVCNSCGEKLVSIDIDPRETESFAGSLTNLACKREINVDFVQFQEWLQQHGPFDAVIDGANVGLINQNTFSFFQLSSVVKQIRQLSPSEKLPLIILHQSRVHGGPAQNPNNKKLLESWKKAGALYATPTGSNDDWYWLYAAVSCKCLLVTNDEMRDHLFQLLGTSFFPRWKEKHQVRLKVSRQGLAFHMPPPYSNIIQESEQGNWHVPTVTGDDLEAPRQWLCASRIKNP